MLTSIFITCLLVGDIIGGGMMTTGKILIIIYSAYGLKLIIAIGLTLLIYLCHTLVERGLGIQPILIGTAPDDVAVAEAPH